VRESARITPEESKEEVRHIVLDVEKTDFRVEVGQNIAVVVPCPHEFGNYDHRRFYSIVSVAGEEGSTTYSFSICVRRCFYIDEINGEQYPGIASNHLCDRQPGDTVQITGPHPSPFSIPDDKTSNLLMFGLGTGITPFVPSSSTSTTR
jgi:ferredoxin--NADP+ reductase